MHRLNRKAKFQLEKDLKDKFGAQTLDEYCENLRNNSQQIHFNDGAAVIEPKYSLNFWDFLSLVQF